MKKSNTSKNHWHELFKLVTKHVCDKFEVWVKTKPHMMLHIFHQHTCFKLAQQQALLKKHELFIFLKGKNELLLDFC